MKWTYARAEYRIENFSIFRGRSALGIFGNQENLDAWFARVSELPPIPGTRSRAFANDYLHCVAWRAVCALKESSIEQAMRRSYSSRERAETLRQYKESDLNRKAFAALSGVPEGTLGRWMTQERV